MFREYVYDQSNAKYENKILLIDYDDLEENCNYTAAFSANGFEIIKYIDDLDFRVKYENKLKTKENKFAVLSNSDDYIPYDIRQQLRECTVSLSKLFPQLNVEVLLKKTKLDLDLICEAYKSNFDDQRQHGRTERFFQKEVYTTTNVEKYLSYALRILKEDVSLANRYNDWFLIAEQKAIIDVLASEYNVEVDTIDINNKFKDYAMTEFGKLSQILDMKTPVLVSRAMEYMHENSTKFIIIVMDGMSEFDWNIISNSFKNIPYEKTSVFAMIPTTTSISRQCLLANKYPSQLVEPWKQSKEKSEFVACAKDLGYENVQIAYARGYEVEFSPLIHCGAIIINDIDDIVHSQRHGRLGMHNDIDLLANQSRLATMVRKLLDSGYDVYISSDHGNTPCKGLGRLMGTGVEVETKSRRMLVLKDFADKDKLLDKYRLIEYPKYYLQRDYDYLICDVGDSLDANGEHVMSHGGITLDEVVVPFIKMKAVKKYG